MTRVLEALSEPSKPPEIKNHAWRNRTIEDRRLIVDEAGLIKEGGWKIEKF
jgi:hypothetical protein